ncbi:MAG TPA: hypothetical protein VNQ77_16635 [Frankiaceae bacterium]|nr:hypothetical protein [Frankiaceae bacterium]
MRIALAAALLLATSFAAPASASKPGPPDGGCGFAFMADPRPESSYDSQLGYIDAGTVTQSGTLTCTVKSGGPSTHDAPYVYGVSVSATGTLGVTVMPPTPVSYIGSLWLIVMCTQFTDVANVTWYFDSSLNEWTTDPHTDCEPPIPPGNHDPLSPALFDLVQTLGTLGDLARAAAKPVACPALAALSPGMPPLLDVRPDGDLYVAGDLLLDCPPETAEPGEELGARGLPEDWPEASRAAGSIRVTDSGSGPEWSLSGTLVSVDWDCAPDGSAVVCDWDGYWAEPECRSESASAVALAPATRARTRVSCVRGATVESAATGAASASLPATYAERATSAGALTSLRCEVDDGSGGPPVAPYVATCGFGFAA